MLSRFSKSSLRARHRRFGEHFDTLFETSSDCLFLVEPDQTGELVYVAVNTAGQRHLPISWQEAKGRSPKSVLGGIAGATISARMAEVYRSGQPYRYQPVFTMAAGETVFDAVYTAVRNRGGAITGVMGVARDITAERHLGAVLFRPHKARVLGETVSQVAENVSSLVGDLSDRLSGLRYDLSSNLRRQMIDEGLGTATRAKTLLDQVRAAGRVDDLKLQTTDIRPILERLQRTVSQISGRPAALRVFATNDLRSAFIDAECLEHTLFGLIVSLRGGLEGPAFDIELRATNLATVANDSDGNEQAWIAIKLTSVPDHASTLEKRPKSDRLARTLAVQLAAVTIGRMAGGVREATASSSGEMLTIELPCADFRMADRAR